MLLYAKVRISTHFCRLITIGRYKRNMKIETRSLQKVSVLLSGEDAHRFEAYCEEFGHKKSTLIARLVRDFLNRENYPAQQSIYVEQAKGS